jgi:TonB-linked SusC/RagA family outer membrane protein
MDAATFAETVNDRAAALGVPEKFTSQEISAFRTNGGTDWQEELYRIANGQEYQLDYSGGNKDLTYFISGNYLDQDGIVENSYFKRYSLRANIRSKLTEKLTSSLKINFIRRENQNTLGDGNTSGALAGTLAWSPTVLPRDESGNFIVRDPISSIKSNPVEMAMNDNINEINTVFANGSLEYELLEGLSVNIGYGVNYSNQQNKIFTANLISSNPTATRASIERLFLQNTNTISYNKTFNEDHAFNITGVAEFQSLQSDQFNVNVNGLRFPNLRFENTTLATGINSDAFKQRQTIASYIGRINYTFKDKYLLTASIRTDGSSKFRDTNRYSTFPAIALGWRLSEESFMKGGFFDDLKIRASWGETGNQGIDVFGTVTTFQTNASAAGTSFRNGVLTSGIIIGNPGNPNLTWETTEQWNVGIDMQILKGRIGLTADYFMKDTRDLLLREPLPQYSGGGSIFRNLGSVTNSGYEFVISGTLIASGDWKWNSNFNASFLTNEVQDIGDREKIFLDGDAGAGLTNLPEMVIIPGNSLSSFWGLKYLGTWKSNQESEAAVFGNIPGDSRYEDVNNDGVIGGDDYQIIGTGIPLQLFGWNNNIDYKNFSLNIFFQSLGGYDKWNFSYATAVMANADAREVTHVDILNRWQANTNENSDIPAFSQSDVSEIQSSRFLENGSFIRLKNVSLSYNLPRNLFNWFDASINLSGMNLWTLTDYRGIDPEAYSVRSNAGEAQGADAGAYPNSKTWVLGINFTF